MRIVELDHDGGYLVRALRRYRDQQEARTGLHLSTIKDSLVSAAFPKKRSPLTDHTMLLLQELGNALEAMLARELALILGWAKPKPRTKDGVICSPDGDQSRARTIDEIKMTWVRFTTVEEFFSRERGWAYLVQIKAYCYVWGYTRARLHILFVGGIKGGSPLPYAKTFILRFTDDELAQNWDVLLQHAEDAGLRKAA